MSKKFLDENGLAKYHEGVTAALNQKENKKHIGDDEPTETGIDTWIDTSGSQTVAISLLSEENETEELTFDSGSSDDDLYFESDNSDGLYFESDN